MTARRFWLLLALAGIALVAFPATAGAHAVVQETVPADGAQLDAAPSEVTIRFNENVTVRDDAIRIVGPDGNPIATDPPEAIDATVRVTLADDLGDGRYVVSWRVISADSHPVAGAFGFAVGDTPAAGPIAAGDAGSTDPIGSRSTRAAITFVSYLGALAAAGIMLFVTFVLEDDRGRPRLVRLARIAAATGAVGVVAAVAMHVIDLVGSGWSSLGDADAWREVVLGPDGASAAVGLIGLGLIVLGASPARHRTWPTAGAVLATAGFVIVGHTRTFGPWWLVTGSDLAHLLTGAIWFGGLVALAVTLHDRRGLDDPADVAVTSRMVAHFSGIAAFALVSVVVFGVLIGWRILGSFDALLHSSYGTTLIVKVVLVACVALLGGFNRFRLVDHVTGDDDRHTGVATRLRRVVTTEATILVAVLAVTGLLVDTNPARTPATTPDAATAAPSTPGPAADDAAAGAPATAELDLDRVTGTVTLDPARVGENRITLAIVDGAGAPVEPIEDPTVTLTQSERDIGPLDAVVQADGPGVYDGQVQLPVEGTWKVRVDVHLDTYDKPIAVAELDVAP